MAVSLIDDDAQDFIVLLVSRMYQELFSRRLRDRANEQDLFPPANSDFLWRLVFFLSKCNPLERRHDALPNPVTVRGKIILGDILGYLHMRGRHGFWQFSARKCSTMASSQNLP